MKRAFVVLLVSGCAGGLAALPASSQALGSETDLAACLAMDTIIADMNEDIDRKDDYLGSNSGKRLPRESYNKRYDELTGWIEARDKLLKQYNSYCKDLEYSYSLMDKVCSPQSGNVMKRYVYDSVGCKGFRKN